MEEQELRAGRMAHSQSGTQPEPASFITEGFTINPAKRLLERDQNKASRVYPDCKFMVISDKFKKEKTTATASLTLLYTDIDMPTAWPQNQYELVRGIAISETSVPRV